MNKSQPARPYGLWVSPITPDHLGSSLSFGDLGWDADGSLLWSESRPERTALVLQPANGDGLRDLNRLYSARGRINYGGGEFTVREGKVFFVDGGTGRVYSQPLRGAAPRPITPAFGAAAAPQVSPDGNWLVYVHSYENRDCLALVDTAGEHWPRQLALGADFYMQPAWHPNGQFLAWIEWDQPNMPWDESRLYLGRLHFPDSAELPALIEIVTVAGGEGVAIFQPAFSPDGRFLAYVSDADGWWQVYVYDVQNQTHRQLTFETAEHGLPAWLQGFRTYAFAPDGSALYVIRNTRGFASLWRVEIGAAAARQVPLPAEYTWLEQIAISPDGEQIALMASASDLPPRIICHSLGGETRVARLSTTEELPADIFSPAEALTWPTEDGSLVHGLFYRPAKTPDDTGELPPLITLAHGGPTSQRTACFNWQVQFFTSRGYAVLQVNYRGSTGYGRAYRNLLRGKWGIYDVQDCVSGALYVAQAGFVDGERMAIMGGSAGGYTVLRTLQEHPGVFKAGICLSGVATHLDFSPDMPKFEARANELLIGPFPASAAQYKRLSPVNAADKLNTPLALFHGEDDRVVPRSNSDQIAAALRRRGVPHIYHLYPGEGHGFRKAETVRHVYSEIEKFLLEYILLA